MYFPLILFLEIVILTEFFQKYSAWGRYPVCKISGQIVEVWQSYKQQKNDFVMELLGNFNRWCHQSNLQHIQKVLKILWLFWKSLTISFSSPRNSLVQIFWICCVHEYSKQLLNTTKYITRREFHQGRRTRMSYRNEQVRDWAYANTHIHKTVHILCTVTNISIKEEITFDAISEAVKFL